jgi:putative tricarboxylic transport membrane protein
MLYTDALWQGLLAVFAWPAFGLMLVGIGIGLVVGLLPGLGGVFALSVMLPFTFSMKPVEAFAFLLGMHAVTNMGGEITSVLFAVPGEASAAAAIVDGHPMAKSGQAGRAIGANMAASTVGGIFGAFVLALAVPIIRPFVLSIGNPELFMLIVLGISFVASLAGRRPVIGILMAGLGFLLSLVGQDPQTGELRFTFGQLFLWQGLPLVSMVLGLFAIPELIELSVRRGSIAEGGAKLGGGLRDGFRDTLREWKLVLGASALGAVIGFVPGIGGSVAQWVAYGWARQRSKRKDLFGKGSIEGILAPGAATNSKEGGHLLPTVVFGIPAGASMALLLAAFLIVGLTPGPKMLSEHLDVTFSLVWIIVVAHVIGVAVCLLFMRHIVAITRVKATIIIPFIISLILLGAYAENNSLENVWIMLLFGAIGYAMVLLDWPRPPMLLAFVLGRLAENYLWLSQQLFGWSWLGRPVVIALMVLIVANLIYSVLQQRALRLRVPHWEEVAEATS